MARGPRGFTIVEMLVVIGTLGVLLGLLVPVLARVREGSGETVCASNLRQQVLATHGYLAAWNGHLPQVAAQVAPGVDAIVGALFGGKRGTLEMFGIDEFGADRRPLNRYLAVSRFDANAEVPVFRCPLDRGQPGDGHFVPHTTSMYDLIGTSYTLNDHALQGEHCWTLVPAQTPPCAAPGAGRPGGRMPRVAYPTRTWVLGDMPVYNYQADTFTGELGDRHQRWHYRRAQVNLAFVDGHLGIGLEVPEAVRSENGDIAQNTTPSFTYLPRPDWFDADALGGGCRACDP